MPVPRLLLAAALLVLVGAGAAALAALQRDAPGASGEFPVEVVGPGGALHAGPVRLANATALDALLATGLRVETAEYPGMGAYVVAVEGHRAAGASGWVFEVMRGGEWRSGDRSAARFALEPGDAVKWSWTGA